MKQKDWSDGIKQALPICLGIIPVGISYGILAMQAGLDRLQTVLMSLLVMAGSSQLAAVGMLGRSTVLAVVMAVFFINLRNFVMSSAVMNDLKKESIAAKLLGAFALCDESFALFSMSKTKSADLLLGINTCLYGVWVLSSFAGCVMGQLLPDPAARSFGIAFYGAFLALLIPNMEKSARICLLVLLTAVVNTLLRFLLPDSWALVLSMTVCAGIGTCFVKEDEEAENEQT